MDTDTPFLEKTVDNLEKLHQTLQNTVDNNLHPGRQGGCSSIHVTLRNCAQVTSKEYKEEYLLYKLCASLK